MHTCESCGMESEDTATFCVGCGSKIARATERPPAPARPQAGPPPVAAGPGRQRSGRTLKPTTHPGLKVTRPPTDPAPARPGERPFSPKTQIWNAPAADAGPTEPKLGAPPQPLASPFAAPPESPEWNDSPFAAPPEPSPFAAPPEASPFAAPPEPAESPAWEDSAFAAPPEPSPFAAPPEPSPFEAPSPRPVSTTQPTEPVTRDAIPVPRSVAAPRAQTVIATAGALFDHVARAAKTATPQPNPTAAAAAPAAPAVAPPDAGPAQDPMAFARTAPALEASAVQDALRTTEPAAAPAIAATPVAPAPARQPTPPPAAAPSASPTAAPVAARDSGSYDIEAAEAAKPRTPGQRVNAPSKLSSYEEAAQRGFRREGRTADEGSSKQTMLIAVGAAVLVAVALALAL